MVNCKGLGGSENGIFQGTRIFLEVLKESLDNFMIVVPW
jgi:hypothetical protein